MSIESDPYRVRCDVGQITSLFVRKMVAQVGDVIDQGALLRSVGIDPDSAVEPGRMIPDTEYYGLLERIAEIDPTVTELPLRTGASMRCEDYGAFGLAFKSAHDLRGSYERTERYARVLTSVATYEVRDGDEGTYMVHHREGDRRLGLRLSIEATLASIVTISREVSSGSPEPIGVFIRHAGPGSALAHERFFSCPVHFEAEEDALLFSRATLLVPNRVGDGSFSRFFDAQLATEVAQLEDERTLRHRVEAEIARSLSGGVPRVSDVARELGMSGRTLQRRLSDRGQSFQGLVDESRRKLAERLLRETGYPLAEVAFLTGFSEQSAFNRAFKRWAGQTPRSYRLRA